MVIEKLEIKGFGKINGLTLNLKEGLNILYGDNEAGKTTIQWFVRAMLYGLKGGRAARDGVPAPLKRFKPWKGSEYGGILEYRLDGGERIRIERDFNTQSVRVFDALYNDITNTFQISREKGIQPGEKHLGMSEDCFEKTACIRQMETRLDGDGNGELLNRLVNISQTGFEDMSFKKAQKALKEALKNYVGTDKTSTRPKDRIIERQEELKNLRDALLSKKTSFCTVENELKEAVNAKDALEKRLLVMSKISELIKVKKEQVKCKKVLARLDEVSADIEMEEVKLAQVQKELDRLKSERDAAGKDKEFRGTGAEKPGIGLIAFAAILLVLAAGSVLIGFMANPAGFAAAAAAFFTAVLLLVRAKAVKRGQFSHRTDVMQEAHKFHDEYENMVNEIINLHGEMKDMYGVASLSYGEHLESRDQISKASEELAYKVAEMDKRLKELIEWINLQEEYGNLAFFEIEKLEGELPESHMAEIEMLWDTCNKRVNEEFHQIGLKIKEAQTLLRGAGDDDDTLQRIDEEIEELCTRKRQLEETGFSLKTALEVLTEASAEIQKDFTPALNRKMSGMIEKLSGGRYYDVKAGDELFLKTLSPETGDIASILALSGGTVDQMYLALRLAAAELIASDAERLPHVMDEVFAQYDDKRTYSGFALLKELAFDRQVIFFTCKRREVDMARNICSSGLHLLELL